MKPPIIQASRNLFKSETDLFLLCHLYHSNVLTFLQTYRHLLQFNISLLWLKNVQNTVLWFCPALLYYCPKNVAPHYWLKILSSNTSPQFCPTVLHHNTAPQHLPIIITSKYCPTILTHNTALHLCPIVFPYNTSLFYNTVHMSIMLFSYFPPSRKEANKPFDKFVCFNPTISQTLLKTFFFVFQWRFSNPNYQAVKSHDALFNPIRK